MFLSLRDEGKSLSRFRRGKGQPHRGSLIAIVLVARASSRPFMQRKFFSFGKGGIAQPRPEPTWWVESYIPPARRIFRDVFLPITPRKLFTKEVEDKILLT